MAKTKKKKTENKPESIPAGKPVQSAMMRELGIPAPDAYITSKNTLDPDDLKYKDVWVKAWIERSIATGPTDESRVEAAIRACYGFANLKSDIPIIWVESPQVAIRAGIIAAIVVENWPKVKELRDLQAHEYTPTPYALATERVLCAVLGDRDYSGQLHLLFEGEKKDFANALVKDNWYQCLDGQFASAWAAYERYWAEVLGLKLSGDLTDRGAAYADTTLAGPQCVHQNFCVVSQRPSAVHINARGVPHCETGPALTWGDQFQLFYLQGVEVPREWIENRANIDPALALTHTNTEQRRVLREFLGWEKILTTLNVQTVDVDSDPQVGTLLEAEVPGLRPPRRRFLKMLCGTGRTFVEQVDPVCRTALEAQAWRVGLTTETYKKPEIRT